MSAPVTTTTTPNKKLFRIGVMLEAIQLSDVFGIEILANLSRAYMDQVSPLSPRAASLAHHAVPMEFLYVASTLGPTGVVPGNNFRFMPTHTYDMCPRDLDLVLIGGPFLTHRPEQADRFMKEAWSKTPVWLTTCTGSLWLASTGLLEGRRCTTNKEFLGAARELYPGVEWVEQRWVIEEKEFDGEGQGGEGKGKGELWTGGAAGAGLKMIANYCLQKYDPDFVKTMGLEGLELDSTSEADQFYRD